MMSFKSSCDCLEESIQTRAKEICCLLLSNQKRPKLTQQLFIRSKLWLRKKERKKEEHDSRHTNEIVVCRSMMILHTNRLCVHIAPLLLVCS